MATTGHESESINVGGLKSSLQALKTKYIDDLEEAIGSGGSVDTRIAAETSRAQAKEQLLQEQYNALTQSDIIVGALPASGTKNKIYRVPGTNTYSDYMWNGSSWVLMATYNNAIDNEPFAGSNNLVKSGGVMSSIEHISIKGQGSTYVRYTTSWLKGGRMYRCTLLSRNLDYTGLDNGLFGILYRLNGVEHNIYLYMKSYVVGFDILDYIDFMMPSAYDEFWIGGRAKIGEKIEFELKDVTDEYSITSDNHIGHTLFTESFIGNNNTYASKDIRSLEPGCTYIIRPHTIEWDKNNVTVIEVGIFSSDYIDDNDVQHNIFASRVISGEIPVVQPYYKFVCPKYKRLFVGGRANAGVEVKFDVIRIDNAIGNEELLRTNFFNGCGTTYACRYLNGLIPGHSYRVYLKSTVWNWDSALLSGGGIISADFIKNGIEANIFVERYIQGEDINVKPYYDFICPDYDIIWVGGRANVNEKVFFSIEDLSVVGNSDTNIVMYKGERFSPIHKTNNVKFGVGVKTSWIGSASAQGMAIYDKYIIQTVETMYDIYEITDNTIIKIASLLSRNLTGSENHANSCQFDNIVENGYDFPLMYVSEYYNKVCHVQRFTMSSGATTIQTISIADGFNLNINGNTFKGDDDYIYSVGFESPEIAGGDGIIKIVKFRKVLTSEGDITLGLTDVLDSFSITPDEEILLAGIQGTKVYDGYLYFQVGGSAANHQGIYKINLTTKQIVSFIDFYNFATEEAEDFDFDFRTNTLYSNVIGNFYIKTNF